ncbi:cell surface A33 antigen-like [Alosa alosa]|uniref:cell surface A33 antigen-like n=1 Tax=Alosa alosa TaxID=278164 RepID=UPI0020153748|nr:cell surface A33 antigen-like [Alosa alosa]
MGTGQKVTFGLYILSALSVILGINVEFQQPEYEVARDDPVTMRCIFQTKKPNSPTVIISWTADADDPTEPQITIGTFYHPGNQIDITSEYEGRVTMTNDVAARISSLSFSRVTMQDNRVFQCAVKIPGDNDGQPADTARLLVLVAPSVPVCNVQGAAEYGHNINLTCKSAEGSPPPTYKWERFDTRNIPQPFPPRTTESNGVLSLFNVSRETSGYYKCTSTNKIRSVSYNMTLSVMPPSMNIGSTAGIIGGCAAGLLVLLIVVYCCCCRKKKNAPDHEMGDAVEFHDKPPLETENESDGIRYGESREDTINQRTGYLLEDRSDRFDTDGRQGGNRYDDRSEGSHSRSRDRLDRQEDSRSRSSDRLDRYDDTRSRSSDRLDRCDDGRSRSSDRLDRYDDGRSRSSDRLDRYDDGRSRSNDRLDRYDDTHSRSSDRLDRYDDGRSRSSDRLDRYEGRRDHYDDRSGRQGDRYEDNRTRYDDRHNYEHN